MLFRKIVSNLPFSPALLNQLGFYAKRLRREQATRRLGLLFTALALIVQTFAMINPPEPALAANPNNIIFNGIHSKEDLLNAWDRNTDGHGHKDVQQIFKFFLGQDFSRNSLENTQKGKFGSRDKVNGGRILSLGRTKQTNDPAQKAHIVRDANGNKSTIWSRHLDAFDSGANRSGRGSMYDAYIGNHKGKWFAIMFDCGNLAISDNNDLPTITPQMTVKATCREVTGYAYDKNNLNANLKIYLYLDGGPGKGEKLSSVANLATPDDNVKGNHGFQFAVPSKYHTGKTYSYTLVVMPAYPENESIQRTGTINTTTCKAAEPVAKCESLKVSRIQNKRDTFQLSTNAYAANGAKITGYNYIVTDQKGAVKYNKSFSSTADTHTTENIVLSTTGAYTAKVTVTTSIGEKTSTECAQPLAVTPAEKCVYNPNLNANDKDCKPCPGDSALWIKDESCIPEIVYAKTVNNLTKNISNANSTTVQAGDRLQYQLYVENTGKVATTLTLVENLEDVLEYADLTDLGGHNTPNFNLDTKTFNWKDITLAPGEKLSKEIVVEVKEQIPATPRSVGNPESYNCRMGNVFGGAGVEVKVRCPGEKVVENTIESLPQTGTGSNIIFSTLLLLVVTYFYMRSRQMNKELRLIRKDFNAGTI